ncbi:hypothetical protein [Niveispirillum sp.]|uniref:hypothetical protein n=1 Tax=Niveispirillum sp. TaxID=1917217 RepID=UPI004035D484
MDSDPNTTITVYISALRAGLTPGAVGAECPDHCETVDIPPDYVAIRHVDTIDMSLGEAMVVAHDSILPPGLWLRMDPAQSRGTVSVEAVFGSDLAA